MAEAPPLRSPDDPTAADRADLSGLGDLSETVAGVRQDLGPDPVSVAEVVGAILGRHAEYGARRAAGLAVAWDPAAERRPVDGWLSAVRTLLRPEVWSELFGRAVIVGLALVDRSSGRRMADAGLFAAVAAELKPALPEALTPAGQDRLATIPLAALAATGRAEPQGRFTSGRPTGPVAVSRTARWVATTREGELTVWRASVQAPWARQDQPAEVVALAFTPDEARLVVLDARGRTRVLRVPDLDVVGQVGEDRPGSTGAISQDGSLVAHGTGDGSVGLVRTEELTTEWVTAGAGGTPTLAVSASGRVAAVAVDTDITTIRLGVPDVGTSVDTIVTLVPTSTLDVGDDATLVLAGSKGLLLSRPDGTVEALAGDPEAGALGADGVGPVLSPDGTRMVGASGPDGVVTLWTWAGGDVLARFLPPDEVPVAALGWSQSGDHLLVGGADGVARLVAVGLSPPETPTPPPRFAADVPGGDAGDLGTGPAVEAFASLVASRTLQPPLAIGLFGEWGSGKTTFMRQLQARVEELSGDARASGALQRDVAFYKHVIQVEFNAWHYREGNLWASLVQALFDQLALFGGEPADAVEARRDSLLEQTALTRSALTAAQDTLGQAADREREARTDLRTLRVRHDRELQALSQLSLPDVVQQALAEPAVAQQLRGLQGELHLTAPVAAVGELYAAVQGARAVLERGRVVGTLTLSKDRGRRWAALLVPTLGGPVAAVAAGALAHLVGPAGLVDVTAVAGGLAWSASTLAAWLRAQTQWASDHLTRIEAVNERIDRRAELLRARHEAERHKLEALVAARATDVSAARSLVVERQTELADLQRELADLTPGRVLAERVASRSASGDYRHHLGLVSVIRTEFEDLSRLLDQENRRLEDPEQVPDLPSERPGQDTRINRIVLYIDDLDRCEPAVVAEVLQAVHLLLAFPLFVVVVGVDARWVTTALRRQLPALVGGDGDGMRPPTSPGPHAGTATPHDYLEKIFQVPFWLRRPEADGTRNLLASMLGPTPPADGTGGTGHAGGGTDGAGRAAERAGGTGAGTARPPDRGRADASGEATAPPPVPADVARRSSDLNPPTLALTAAERRAFDDVAPLLCRSPRALKRYVNVYRLVKAMSSDPLGFAEDRGPGSPFRLVQFLLAVVIGAPAAAHAVMDAVRREPTATVAEAVGRLRMGGPAGPELTELVAWLGSERARGVGSMSCPAVAAWVDPVARFSFDPAAAGGRH